jgi:MFS family permease
MYALLFQLPIFFEQVRRLEPGLTGRTIIGMMIAMVLAAPLGGRLSERFGARATVFCGSMCSLAGILLIGPFDDIYIPGDVLSGLILLGLGLGLSSAPSQAAAMGSVGPSQAGMAGGAVSTGRYIGGVIGVAMLGYLLGRDAGIQSHTAAAVVYGAALFAALGASLVLPGRPGSAQTDRRA